MGVQEQWNGRSCYKDGYSHDADGKIYKVTEYRTMLVETVMAVYGGRKEECVWN